MSKINDLLNSRIRTAARDPLTRAVADKVKASNLKGVSSQEVLDVAIQATQDQYVKSGKPAPSSDVIREKAFLGAAVAASEKPFEMKDLPEGSDKTQHFFTSGVLSLTFSKWADTLLPTSWANWLGEKASFALGFGKEIYDKFFATGFNRDDLKADLAGAKRPFQIEVPKK